MPISKEVLEASKIVTKKDQEFGERVKYPLAVKWNRFVKHMEDGKRTWDALQKEIDLVGKRELEMRYPTVAQRHLAKFRNVNFDWAAGMFVDYYRGAGGIEAMYIVLPPETKTLKKEEKEDDSKED